MEIILDYSGGPSVILWALRSKRGRSKDQGGKMRQGEIREIESMSRMDPILAVLKLKGFINQGMQKASGSWEWSLVETQQGNRVVSPTGAWNWTLPTRGKPGSSFSLRASIKEDSRGRPRSWSYETCLDRPVHLQSFKIVMTIVLGH